MPSKMPEPPRRRDGFSDDGLSYSVASDFDKQMGQALAEYEARTKDPRYIPGAQVERPDSPDILRRELIDPITLAFGGEVQKESPQQAAKTYHVGNQLIKVDPQTSTAEAIFTGPSTQSDLTKRGQLELSDALAMRRSIMSKPAFYRNKDDQSALEAAQATIDRFKQSSPPLLGDGKSVLPAAQSRAMAPDEVERPLKNGRRAIFNKVTREFIRYAD